MKKILFASTAAAAMTVGSMASAQAISLFGDARLGLGYGVVNSGAVRVEDGEIQDELRAISRVRFGVNMTGETPTGITFGATIRADNARRADDPGGQGASAGQTAGNVFVSGVYGTLTFGDINEAHQNHTGDLHAVGLTALGDINEIPYLGNRRNSIGPVDDRDQYRPTVRYDYDFGALGLPGLGVSASTGRDLNSIAVGASYGLDVAGFSFTLGGGYYEDDFNEDQWSVGLSAGLGFADARVIYTNADSGLETIGASVGTTFADIGFTAFYQRLLSDDDGNLYTTLGGSYAGLLDGDDMYGVGMTYSLGGGATLAGGVARTFPLRGIDGPDAGDRATVADLGIRLAF